jgi:mono/diheme cytochrome c family protein
VSKVTEAPEGDDHDREVGEAHGVPLEFIDMTNPVLAGPASISRGAELYKSSCLSCHGPEGRGDGTMAMNLDPKPSNLHQRHVQENSDGALFYMISEGTEGKQMPGFRETLLEEDRWHLVNYMRSFEVEEGKADDHDHGDHDH